MSIASFFWDVGIVAAGFIGTVFFTLFGCPALLYFFVPLAIVLPFCLTSLFCLYFFTRTLTVYYHHPILLTIAVFSGFITGNGIVFVLHTKHLQWLLSFREPNGLEIVGSGIIISRLDVLFHLCLSFIQLLIQFFTIIDSIRRGIKIRNAFNNRSHPPIQMGEYSWWLLGLSFAGMLSWLLWQRLNGGVPMPTLNWIIGVVLFLWVGIIVTIRSLKLAISRAQTDEENQESE